MANNKNAVANLKPFKKGDPRINRNGRPKSFDTLRKLAQQLAHEKATVKGKTLIINGKTVTMTEAILRQWAMSKNPKMQQLFMEVAYGKVPNVTEVELSGGIDITKKVESAIDKAYGS